MSLAAGLLAAYLLGSVPSGYLLARGVKGVDLRTVGSGNVGATNALRALGIWGGAAVLLLDVLKGVVASAWIPQWTGPEGAPVWSLAYGTASVLGHDFPCWLRFRGGKGVATTLGVLVASVPPIAGIAAAVWAAVFVLCRYVSLSSMALAVAIPLGQLALHRPVSELIPGAGLGLLIVLRHRPNIQRLLAGAEHRAVPLRRSE